jgi:hypothetical protein
MVESDLPSGARGERGGRAALILGVALACGCSFQHRSEDYACEVPSDCGSGRTCDQGWCVEVGGPVVDADPNAPDADPNAPDAQPADAFVCPGACDFCDELAICHIQCSAGTPCNTAPVVCPAGVACKVECMGTDTCEMGVDCTASSNCRVECTGSSSCGGPIACGEGPCTVECTNTSTCTGGIDCVDSCSCLTDCSGGGACVPPPECPAGCGSGGDCRNNQQECNTCTAG